MHIAKVYFFCVHFFSVLTDHKFASAGREDIDVRMLGNGKSELLPPSCLPLGQHQKPGL